MRFFNSSLKLTAFLINVLIAVSGSAVLADSEPTPATTVTHTDQSAAALFKKNATLQRKISTAKDGFKTFYVELTPKKFDPKTGTTIVLTHGFSMEGLYWIDFIKAAKLIEQGYRVIMPDLMTRGKTMALNFPLDSKGQWNPTEAQQELLSKVTLANEAKYLHEMLINDYPNSQGRLIVSGHSRGAGVSANLQLILAKENLADVERGDKPRWNVASHWGFNSFVAYTTAKFPGMKSVSNDMYSDPSNISGSRREKVIYQAYLKRVDLEPTLSAIDHKVIDTGSMSPDEIARFYSMHNDLAARIPELMEHYNESFEGLGETMFINKLMEKFTDQKEKLGYNKYANRGMWDREQALMEATMNGLRTRYNLNVNSAGRSTINREKIMIPDSIIGVYAELLSRTYPGIAQDYHLIQGTQDEIVPMKLVQHLIASSNEVQRGAVKLHILKNTGHYGPGHQEVQALFSSQMNQCISVYRPSH